jgi:hypothetical protein
MGPGPHPELSGIALNLLRNKRSIGLAELSSASSRRLTRRPNARSGRETSHT